MIRKVYPKLYRVIGKKLIKEVMRLENINWLAYKSLVVLYHKN
jgi:hypothetical protein